MFARPVLWTAIYDMPTVLQLVRRWRCCSSNYCSSGYRHHNLAQDHGEATSRRSPYPPHARTGSANSIPPLLFPLLAWIPLTKRARVSPKATHNPVPHLVKSIPDLCTPVEEAPDSLSLAAITPKSHHNFPNRQLSPWLNPQG